VGSQKLRGFVWGKVRVVILKLLVLEGERIGIWRLIKEIIVELNSKGGFGLPQFAREEGRGIGSLKKFASSR
jgi:hypothetical protein